MGLRDLFGQKKKLDYDPLDIKLTDIREGFMLDYDLKTWIVKEMYEYDWGNNYFTREFKLDSGDDIVYMHVQDDDKLSISVSRKVKIRSIDEDLPEYIAEHDFPPKKLIFNGVSYFKDSEEPGFYRNVSTKSEWTEFISWEYYDDLDKNTLTIEQWGEREFDASNGFVVKEYEISNILPG